MSPYFWATLYFFYFIFRQKQKDLERKEERKAEPSSPKNLINLIEDKVEPFSPERKYLVLKFFMTHFLKMGKKSNRLRLKGQSYMYMQMSKIISEQIKKLNYGDMQEALKLHDELKDFERVVDRSDYFEDYWSIR